MTGLRFTEDAEADLAEIAVYTVRAFGETQAIRYIDQLEQSCRRLACRPRLGRVCDYILPGLKRFERGKQVIFYSQSEAGILVVRVLHHALVPHERLFQGGL